VRLERRRHTGAFGGAQRGALLKLIAVLLAVMRGINNFFDSAYALEVAGDAHLLKEIYGPLHARELALALRSKGAVALYLRLKRSLRQGERSGRQRNKGGGGDVGVIMMILLILASLLFAALLLAVLAVARRPTSLLLLLLALLALLLLLLLPILALLLVELGIFPLVLDCGYAVGVFSATSIAATKTALFLGGFQGFGIVQWLWMLVGGDATVSRVDHLLIHN
jgi:cytochrome bd-type quinol oxidase subunit 2